MNNTTPAIEAAEKAVQVTWLAFRTAINEAKELGLADPWTREVRAFWSEAMEAKYVLAELQIAEAKVAA